MPEVLAVEGGGNSVALDVYIPQTLDYFLGHFPGLPILPGVVQVDWAVRLSAMHFNIETHRFSALKALKFTAPVLPDRHLTLLLQWLPEKKLLDFKYLAGDRKYSSGQILFAETESR